MICIKCQREVPDGAYCIQCGAAQERRRSVSGKRGNGRGSVYRRGKTWTAMVTLGRYCTDDGKSHQIRSAQGGFRTKGEALDALASLRNGRPKEATLQRLWDTYRIGAYEKLSASKKTAYTIAIDRWRELMSTPISELTLTDLQTVLNKQAKTYYPARDMQSVLSHCYKIAMAEQRTTVNLARLLTLPDKEEQSPEPFSEIELRKLWDAYKADRFLAFPLLMIYTGMMPGELLDLKSEHIDTVNREIRGAGKKTKKRKETAIVYPEFLDGVVQDLMGGANKNGKIVGMNKDHFYEEYYRHISAAGVRDLPPYSCRHTTATALALGNIAPSVIQEIMRHSKFSTTQKYIHLTSKEAHEAVNKMTCGAS